MTIALVCPDGFSVLLFCKGIIAALREGGWTRVLVVTEVGSHRAELDALGVECVDVAISRFVDPVADVRYVAELLRVFKQERCDAVLNFSTKPNVYGAIAARLAGVERIVSHVVGLGATFLPDGRIRSRIMRSVMRQLYRASSRISRFMWFTNRTDRAYFVETGLVDEARTILTRNYLDTAYYSIGTESAEDVVALRRELGFEPDDVVVLMVARLIWPKGVGEFAGAAALLDDRCPKCRFVLVAPPEPPSPTTVPAGTVREYERGGNFQWLGFRRDVRRLYAACDIAVLPTYYKEGGYPRALLEPMSMGRPLITTTSEDCRGTVDEGQNGLLVPPRDASALASAIETLANDPSLRAAFGAHSRAKAIGEFEERAILSGALHSSGLIPA